MLPKSVPVNISVNLQLKKIGPKSTNARGEKQDLIALELQTAATNPSPREVYLLKSAWIAVGCDIGKTGEDPSFYENAERSLNEAQEGHLERYMAPGACSYVAAGHLFGDTVLKPNETTRRTKIFYLPVDKFDHVEVQVRMPTSEQREGVELQWKINDLGLEAVLYHVAKDGQRTEFAKDKDGAYIERDLARFGLQEAHSSSSLSLWQ